MFLITDENITVTQLRKNTSILTVDAKWNVDTLYFCTAENDAGVSNNSSSNVSLDKKGNL